MKELLHDIFCPGLTRVELLTEIGVAMVTGVAIAVGLWLA